MKLELKHLAPYLPYGLEMILDDKIHKLNVATFSYRLDDSKPILRPLSDLTKEIEIDGKRFLPFREMIGLIQLMYTIDPPESWKDAQPIQMREKFEFISIKDILKFGDCLYEWHFDVFGLIPEGLAIDVNTIMK